ncbi:MAG: hypothetical protein ACRC5M_02445 [Anaeroplasmataceae bacterium]
MKWTFIIIGIIVIIGMGALFYFAPTVALQVCMTVGKLAAKTVKVVAKAGMLLLKGGTRLFNKLNKSRKERKRQAVSKEHSYEESDYKLERMNNFQDRGNVPVVNNINTSDKEPI